MDTVGLKEYLGIVVDMEQSIYMQKQLSKRLDDEIDALSMPKQLSAPRKPNCPEAPREPVKTGNSFWLLFACPIVWILSMIPCALVNTIDGAEAVTEILMIASIIPPILLICSTVYANRKPWKRYEIELAEHNVKYKEYQVQMCIYEQELERFKRELESQKKERKIKIEILRERQMLLHRKIEDSSRLLNDIYKKNIVFPKYRNLIMACSLYEYICAGRCVTLEGHEGAYNILEMEIRLDRVITQLDEVIVKLNAIQQNQFMLYSAIQESKQQVDTILKSTHNMAEQLYTIQKQSMLQGEELNAQIVQLQKSSALSAYYTERAHKEIHYLNRMNYLSGKNDGVFFNQPPM